MISCSHHARTRGSVETFITGGFLCSRCIFFPAQGLPLCSSHYAFMGYITDEMTLIPSHKMSISTPPAKFPLNLAPSSLKPYLELIRLEKVGLVLPTIHYRHNLLPSGQPTGTILMFWPFGKQAVACLDHSFSWSGCGHSLGPHHGRVQRTSPRQNLWD